jgi:two-component system, NtrC family, response regulator HydG
MEKSPQLPLLALIEDDEDLRDLVDAFFRQKGYRVAVFGDPRELLREIETNHFSPAAIISDLMLPNLTGIELTKKIRALGNDVPIILITAHKTSESAIEAIEAGAYDFVVKPIHFPQLQISVERALHFNRIRKENLALKSAVALREGLGIEGIVGRSSGLMRAVDLARRVADSSASVFISGETGTGKEVIAKAIHQLSRRAKHPFVAINCSAIPENLLESELFGHVKGAFTGAADKKIGLFEEAGEGTLFLDEIGDLSPPLQAKLLRVLQERKIKRLGENVSREIQARIISATHKDLRQEIREKKFREDLFFRLNVIPIHLPPLRQRQEDILPLADFFLKKFAALNQKRVEGFSKSALEYLLKNPWKGNVRELENSIERAVVLCEGQVLEASDLEFDSFEPAGKRLLQDQSPAGAESRPFSHLIAKDETALITMEELNNRYLLYALERNHGAKDKTARDLGIDRKTLYRRLQEIRSEKIESPAGEDSTFVTH